MCNLISQVSFRQALQLPKDISDPKAISKWLGRRPEILGNGTYPIIGNHRQHFLDDYSRNPGAFSTFPDQLLEAIGEHNFV